MGFFKDFKRDFAQAVNELMPDKDELAEEYDDEDMVNTFDEADNMEVAPEDVFENLDDFKIDAMEVDTVEPVYEEAQPEEPDEEPEGTDDSHDLLENIPDAEVISEPEEYDDEQEDAVSAVLGVQGIDDEDGEQAETVVQELTEEEVISGTDLNHDVLLAMKMREEQEQQGQDEQEQLEKEPEEEPEPETEKIVEEESMITEEIKIDAAEQDMENIASADTTYITKGTTITGNIETDGGVDIIGTVVGDVNCGNKLIVGGTITGNVHAGELYANAAKIEGEITCDSSVKIGVGSVVVGNVAAASAVIAGAINGDIDVQGPVIVDSTAVIMGNIKSRSVQINNGAVIEGFCSQCYSEIDVKSFFG